MAWLKNTKFKGQEDKVDIDSSSWANYSDLPTNTGNSNYKANEIYNLAGNYYDCTQEACSINERNTRGGDSVESSFNTPVSMRHSIDTKLNDWTTSRATL